MPVEARLALELATADGVDTGMARVLGLLLGGCGAARVEWWAPDEEGRLRLRASDGAGRGQRHRFSLGPAGDVVMVGGRRDPRLASALACVMPILRRRCVEERLLAAAMKLALRNETLEDFAALVAHELKTPLQAALVADDASTALERALDLVDSLIEVARDSRERPYASAAACLEEVLLDLGSIDAEVTAEVTAILPLPEVSLRVILRNLLRNAIAAGARHVHVVAARSSGAWALIVDDDGVGMAAAGSYSAGSGLGLRLCRRIADRYGGALELAPRPAGGTRATLQPAAAS
jgi:signal transduction histidine kinase